MKLQYFPKPLISNDLKRFLRLLRIIYDNSKRLLVSKIQRRINQQRSSPPFFFTYIYFSAIEICRNIVYFLRLKNQCIWKISSLWPKKLTKFFYPHISLISKNIQFFGTIKHDKSQQTLKLDPESEYNVYCYTPEGLQSVRLWTDRKC